MRQGLITEVSLVLKLCVLQWLLWAWLEFSQMFQFWNPDGNCLTRFPVSWAQCIFWWVVKDTSMQGELHYCLCAAALASDAEGAVVAIFQSALSSRTPILSLTLVSATAFWGQGKSAKTFWYFTLLICVESGCSWVWSWYRGSWSTMSCSLMTQWSYSRCYLRF